MQAVDQWCVGDTAWFLDLRATVGGWLNLVRSNVISSEKDNPGMRVCVCVHACPQAYVHALIHTHIRAQGVFHAGVGFETGRVEAGEH